MDAQLERFQKDLLRLSKDLETGKIHLTNSEFDRVMDGLDFGDPDWNLKWPELKKVIRVINTQYDLLGEKGLRL